MADLRAPTPSAAAELAVQKIINYQDRLRMALLKKVELMKLSFEKVMSSVVFREPLRKVNDNYLSLDNLLKRLEAGIKIKSEKEKNKYIELVAKLDTLSPLKTLSRGYSITEKEGKIIKSKDELIKGDKIDLRFIDGRKSAIID